MEIKTKKIKELFPGLVDDFARRLNRDPDELWLIRKRYESKGIEVSKGERTVVSRISTNEKDRDGEVLEPSGIVLDAYKNNRVVLWSHSYSNPDHVIGKNLWIKPTSDGSALIAKTVFAKHKFADQIFRAYTEDLNGHGKLLNSWSVGFLPVEWIDGKKAGDPKRTYKKWELLEYSACPIGSNPNALTLSLKKGIITNGIAKQIKSFSPDIEFSREDIISTIREIDFKRIAQEAVAREIGRLKAKLGMRGLSSHAGLSFLERKAAAAFIESLKRRVEQARQERLRLRARKREASQYSGDVQLSAEEVKEALKSINVKKIIRELIELNIDKLRGKVR